MLLENTNCLRDWQPTPVFLPGEFHGQRILAGYSPWGCKELDMTESRDWATDTHRTPIKGKWLTVWQNGDVRILDSLTKS